MTHLKTFLQTMKEQKGYHLAEVTHGEDIVNTIAILDGEELETFLVEFEQHYESSRIFEYYGYILPLLLEEFSDYCYNRADEVTYDFVYALDAHSGWQVVSSHISRLARGYVENYRGEGEPGYRRWYTPMHRTHMESSDGPSTHAYACLSQDITSVYRIQERLGRYDIDAVMFLTETGDYSEIYVSFHGNEASFSANKQWFKVTEKKEKV